MVNRIIVFDVWGEFAHFRRSYTTSSPLTFSFPPPTTVRGLVGAILVLRKEEYIEITNRLKVGISILSPLRRLRFALNYISTKGKNRKFEPTLFRDRKASETLRTQVQVEFLRDVKYRIYIGGESSLLDSLLNYLPYRKTEFTPCLGLSECLADFSFVGEFEAEPVGIVSRVRSVIPRDRIRNLEFNAPMKLAKERVPVSMNTNREVTKYEDVVFDVNGKELEGEFTGVYRIGKLGENVYMFDVSP